MARTSFKIEWDAHEYEHKIRTEDWFWAVGIVTLAAALAAIIFGDIIFGILIVVAAFALSLFINRPPETVHVVVDEDGISRGKTLYPFRTLHSFWIDVESSHPRILLRSQKTFMPLIHVPLGKDVDVERLHKVLTQYIPEEFYGHHLMEKLLDYLGF